jgi:hypothetical protein
LWLPDSRFSDQARIVGNWIEDNQLVNGLVGVVT